MHRPCVGLEGAEKAPREEHAGWGQGGVGKGHGRMAPPTSRHQLSWFPVTGALFRLI